jgi:hypothetical protein
MHALQFDETGTVPLESHPFKPLACATELSELLELMRQHRGELERSRQLRELTHKPGAADSSDSDSEDMPSLVLISSSDDSGPDGEDCSVAGSSGVSGSGAGCSGDGAVVSIVGEEVNRSHKQTGRRSDLVSACPPSRIPEKVSPNGKRPGQVEHQFLFPDECTSYPTSTETTPLTKSDDPVGADAYAYTWEPKPLGLVTNPGVWLHAREQRALGGSGSHADAGPNTLVHQLQRRNGSTTHLAFVRGFEHYSEARIDLRHPVATGVHPISHEVDV